MHADLKQFTQAALQGLLSYTWPGNTRQLENEIKRLVALRTRGKSITRDHLDAAITNLPKTGEPAKEPLSGKLPVAVEQLDAADRGSPS